VPPYVADFYCGACKPVVELDGSQHDDKADQERTRFLETKSLKVMRFWDNEVLQQTDAVLEAILDATHDRILTPTPLPEGEGLKSKER
jgi:very-short-patch-repair endonuclease